MSALATALLKHKKVRTTVAKAKETRLYVEPLITRAKRAHLLTGDEKAVTAARIHARRMVGRFIKDADVLKTLFTEIAPKVADRPGGYTRVVKLGRRQGDAAEIAMIELVDWNTDATPKTKISKPRPTRRKATPAATKTTEAAAATTATTAEVVEEPAASEPISAEAAEPTQEEKA
jgi:large subunit ribosomal protein L17